MLQRIARVAEVQMLSPLSPQLVPQGVLPLGLGIEQGRQELGEEGHVFGGLHDGGFEPVRREGHEVQSIGKQAAEVDESCEPPVMPRRRAGRHFAAGSAYVWQESMEAQQLATPSTAEAADGRRRV